MNEDNFWIFAILAIIILGFINLVPKLENHRTERIELMRKYPECLQACRPYTCIRYKREIERLGL